MITFLIVFGVSIKAAVVEIRTRCNKSTTRVAHMENYKLDENNDQNKVNPRVITMLNLCKDQTPEQNIKNEIERRDDCSQLPEESKSHIIMRRTDNIRLEDEAFE